MLRALVEQQGHFARIAAALSYLRLHYAEPLGVDELASRANMSVSTFHEHFKRCTDLAPMQYQAPALAQGAADADRRRPGVAQVAHRVGYQSTSQFSREYKRQFARSPGEELPYQRLPV